MSRMILSASGAMIDPDYVAPPPTFAERQAQLSQAVNAHRERMIVEGRAFTVAGVADPIPLQGRPFDQTVYLALLTRASGYKAAGVTDPVLKVRAADDVIHMLTPDQMISLVGQAMTWFEAVMAASWAIKDDPDGIAADFADDPRWP